MSITLMSVICTRQVKGVILLISLPPHTEEVFLSFTFNKIPRFIMLSTRSMITVIGGTNNWIFGSVLISATRSDNLHSKSSQVIPKVPVLAVCLQIATSIALSSKQDRLNVATKGVSLYSLIALLICSIAILTFFSFLLILSKLDRTISIDLWHIFNATLRSPAVAAALLATNSIILSWNKSNVPSRSFKISWTFSCESFVVFKLIFIFHFLFLYERIKY